MPDLAVTAILLVVFIGAWYYLDGHNHENWALLAIALSAGAAYALVAALIEKTTGFRIVSAMAE